MLLSRRYELRSPIGRGGMGGLWEGVDTKLNRRVAVKRIRGDRLTDDTVRRFNREARVMALLRHPGVPAVHDFGDDDYGLFLVMDYIEGWTLAHVLDSHERLPVPWAAMVGAQLCAVLSAAHARSLIHRDLKPSNLMLCPDSTLVVLDFGVATVMDSPDFSKITRTIDRPGTDRYMAPERARSGKTTTLTDLYSVGCVLYEMITGQRVFQNTSLVAEIGGHIGIEPPRPSVLEASVPRELDDLVLALLDKDPARRPQRAEHVYQHLMPFVRDLPSLPGVIDPSVTPLHMYAEVLARGAQLTSH